MSVLKKFLKVFLKGFSLKISKINNKPIYNYFKKSNTKNVLISYIVRPFNEGFYYNHTNGFEALEIAQIFDEFDYNVDVADWLYPEHDIDYRKYDVIFGFGEPMEMSFRDINCRAMHIYYGTTCYPPFQNSESIKRLQEAALKKGKYFTGSTRIDKVHYLSLFLSEFVIVKGNKFVSNTYENALNKKVFNLNTSSIKVFDIDLDKKNFEIARKNFIWFGSAGFIHKGLDLVLEFFRANPHLNLHICAKMSIDEHFQKTYYEELYNTPNIFTHGFVDIRSEKFIELIYECAFLIFPSCSEGGCAGQVNLMRNGGLIPILTENCGLDIESYGYIIPKIDIESIENTISETYKIGIDEMKKKSQSALHYTETFHTLESFKFNLKQILLNILP
jgi:hypothetical protein